MICSMVIDCFSVVLKYTLGIYFNSYANATKFPSAKYLFSASQFSRCLVIGFRTKNLYLSLKVVELFLQIPRLTEYTIHVFN